MPDLATLADAGAPEYDDNYDDEEGVGPLPDDEENEEVNAKLEEALQLNAQLKAMMMQAEESERQAAMMRRGPGGGGPRPMVDTRRQPGGAMHRGAAPPTTGPRLPGAAKNGGWGGHTHTDGRAREINRDNQILVQKLSNIAVSRNKPGGSTGQSTQQPFRIPKNRTSVSINQRRKDDQIARENAAMARRLNSVKPTAALSSKTAAQHSAKHNTLLRVLGQPRAGAMPVSSHAPPRTAGSRAGSAAPGQQPRRSTLPQLRMHTDGPAGFQF